MTQASATRLAFKAAALGGATFLSSQALLFWRQPCWRVAAAPPEGSQDFSHPDFRRHPHKKTAIVVGAGVAGICSAYQFARRGYDVVVIDALSGPAAEGSASAAAAGGMEKMHKFSTAADWKNMFSQLLPGYDGFRFFYISWLDVIGDLFFWRWLARFASESLFASPAHINAKKDGFLPMVDWGINETIRVMDEVPGLKDASYFSEAGSVKIIEQASGKLGFASLGTGGTVSLQEAQKFEPMLAGISEDGATTDHLRFVVNPESAFGECVNFTRHLAQHCEQCLSVKIVRDTSVHGFKVTGDRIEGIHSSRGYIDVGESTVILCGGAWSGILCDMIGVFCPIYPLKGYTVLVDLDGASGLTRLAFDASVYAVPAGPRLRIASIGGLGGWDTGVDDAIELAVKAAATKLLPLFAEKIKQSSAIAGLRPFSADEMPLVGSVPGFSNVLLNTGPGHTGWKCAAGFAEILAGVADVGGSSAQQALPANSQMLAPKGRLGFAFTGPRLLREARMVACRSAV